MLTTMKTWGCRAAVAVVPVMAGSAVFAQDGATINPPTLVDPTNLATALTDAAGTWMLIGLGIGVSVFAVKLGWTFLKKFAGN